MYNLFQYLMYTAWDTVGNVKFSNIFSVKHGSSFSTGEAWKLIGDGMEYGQPLSVRKPCEIFDCLPNPIDEPSVE